MSDERTQALVRAGAGSLAQAIRDLQAGGASWSRADVQRWATAVDALAQVVAGGKVASPASSARASTGPVQPRPSAGEATLRPDAGQPSAAAARPPAVSAPASQSAGPPELAAAARPPTQTRPASASAPASTNAPASASAPPPWARKAPAAATPPAESPPPARPSPPPAASATAAATPSPAASAPRAAETPPPAAVPSPPAIGEALALANPGARMDALQRALGDCRACGLCQSRGRIVWGVGDPSARLMFIGEAPGADEDRLGEPFVGEAGALLDRMIAAMGLQRREVYIANTVKCRPPNNRNPLPEETAPCSPWLRAQIEAVAPEVIVALGRVPMEWLLPDNQVGITRLRGTWQRYGNIDVMPTFHPAYLLRQPTAKRDVWADLQAVMARLGQK